jgi:hypothetical protein
MSNMQTIQWLMMGAFIVALALSVWKIYLFLPNKPLPNDERDPASVEKLQRIMVECNEINPKMDEATLFQKMIQHKDFDSKYYWRFNLNRLRHIIDDYRFIDPNFRR